MQKITHAAASSSKYMAMAFSSLTLASSLRAHIAKLASDTDASTTQWVIIDPNGNKRNVSINIDADYNNIHNDSNMLDDDSVFNRMNSKTE